MKKPELKKIKKRTAAAVAASVASAGIVVGGLFSSPSELMGTDAGVTPLVQTMAADDGVIGDDGDDAALAPEEKRRGARAQLRQWIMHLPPWLRASVGVPLWGLGWLLISSFTALWGAVLSPTLGAAVKFFCVAALVLAVLCVSLKAAFPQLRLKDILNKRSVFTVVLGLALVGVAGVALDIFYPEGESVRELVRWGGGFAVLLAAGIPVIIKNARQAPPEPETSPEDEELRARRLALEIADSAVK